MFKVQIRGQAGTLMACKFDVIDFPMVSLLFLEGEMHCALLQEWKESAELLNATQSAHWVEILLPRRQIDVAMGEAAGKIWSGLMGISEPVRITARLRYILDDLLGSPEEAGLRPVYFKAKVAELLIVLFSDADLRADLRKTHTGFSLPERQQFDHIRTLITDDLKKNYTIEALADIAGMNRTKLQSGFKAQFGQTIHAFTFEAKMQEAKRILSGPARLSLKELASILGYSHASHFSAAFKKRFNVAPSAFYKGLNLLGYLVFLAC